MFSYEKVKGKPRIIISLTSLKENEFDELLEKFRIAEEEYIKKEYIEKPGRKRGYGAGRKPKLSKPEDRLLFILFYFKVYPIQEVIAFLFNMSQCQANEWIHRLSIILKIALGYEICLPERNPKNLEEVLEECPVLEFILDATERRIQRPKDNEKQKENYSGKKKCHTKKNNIITEKRSKKIKYLSKTYEGKKHDKSICDDEDYNFPNDSLLYEDLGYLGYDPPNVKVFRPKKKPRNKELSLEEKENNKNISKIRIYIEHTIGSIKRCRIVKDTYRNHKKKYYDLVMEISCALHNFRVDNRLSIT